MNLDPVVDRVELMTLRAGDVLVLRFPELLPRAQLQHIRQTLLDVLPDKVQCLILDGQVGVQVLRPGLPIPLDVSA